MWCKTPLQEQDASTDHAGGVMVQCSVCLEGISVAEEVATQHEEEKHGADLPEDGAEATAGLSDSSLAPPAPEPQNQVKNSQTCF